MKTIVEITRLSSGVSNSGPWVRLAGRDHRGKSLTAVAFAARAEKMLSELGNLVPEGEDIANRRLIVEMTGEFRDGKQIVRDGKPVTRFDGSPVLQRSFHIEGYNVLTGPTLELTRIRRDGEAAMAKAEALRADGENAAAYLVLMEFAGKACNRSVEVVVKDDAEDEEFGEPQAAGETAAVGSGVRTDPSPDARRAVHDPEAAAAATFALEDFMSNPASPPQPARVAENGAAVVRDVLDDETVTPLRRSDRAEVDDEVAEAATEASAEPEVARDEAPVRRRIGLGMRR